MIRLRYLRAKRDLNLYEVSDACNLPGFALYKIESRRSTPNASTMNALERYFGEPIDVLLSEVSQRDFDDLKADSLKALALAR